MKTTLGKHHWWFVGLIIGLITGVFFGILLGLIIAPFYYGF